MSYVHLGSRSGRDHWMAGDRDVDSYPDDKYHRIWDPDYHIRYRWTDFEPFLQQLTDQEYLIAWLFFHEYKNQTEIGKIINRNQSVVRDRLSQISRRLRVLLDPLKFDDLPKNLSDREKFLLCEYWRAGCNYKNLADKLGLTFTKVHYPIKKIMNKLNGHRAKIEKKFNLINRKTNNGKRCGLSAVFQHSAGIII